jgi:hypothetical protein
MRLPGYKAAAARSARSRDCATRPSRDSLTVSASIASGAPAPTEVTVRA